MLEKIVDGRTDLIIDYVQQNQNADLKDSNGTALIVWAAYYGDVTAVKHLLSHGASLSDLGENYDLNGAAFHGHWQLCQYLIEQGADVNFALNDSGETALHSCLTKANRPANNYILNVLLANGADPNVKTKERAESASFMRDAITKAETPLHRAAAYGDEESIQLLLDHKADKKIKDMNGDSPLSWASYHLRPGKILSLLTYDDHQVHPLHEQRMKSDHGFGWSDGLELNLLGKVHTE